MRRHTGCSICWAARWDADALQARLSEYVQDKLGSPDAVLILDETGFLK